MPTYDYKCLECDKVFEHIQAMSEPDLEECLCKKEQFLVKRMISAPQFVINDKSSMTDTKLYKELGIDK